MEVLLNAVRSSYMNQESKVLALHKLKLAFQQGKISSKVQIQPSLSVLEEFLDNRTLRNKESFNDILKRMEDSYDKILCEERILTESIESSPLLSVYFSASRLGLRASVPSSVLIILSPSTYRFKNETDDWMPITISQNDWRLFEGLEYEGKRPCWITTGSELGVSGMVNSGVNELHRILDTHLTSTQIWLGLTLRSFGCSLGFLDGHWYSLIQHKEVGDFDGWVTYLAAYDCHIEVEW
ncbi:hypothetical protein DL96DRAFT_597513 [Flagelloscypha sp. PMI_526]|nr:hypothetical protein DL96DRAFT_597513 [Flagelloscypha sp. PMI_526]